MATVKDIYRAIDKISPFSKQEEWDNSGFLVGDMEAEVTKTVTALDITVDVVKEAEKLGAELIISHHPVIFKPLKAVKSDSPVGMLLSKGISAICVHTPFDVSPIGMNKGLYDILGEPLGLDIPEPLDDLGDGSSLGKIYHLEAPLTAEEAAKLAGKALGCPVVRWWGDGIIDRLAICSGSGNSLLSLAQGRKADAVLSGDFKHDVIIDAHNMGMIVIDCGHYYTERIFAPMMAQYLADFFPEIEFICSEADTDPVHHTVIE